MQKNSGLEMKNKFSDPPGLNQITNPELDPSQHSVASQTRVTHPTVRILAVRMTPQNPPNPGPPAGGGDQWRMLTLKPKTPSPAPCQMD